MKIREKIIVAVGLYVRVDELADKVLAEIRAEVKGIVEKIPYSGYYTGEFKQDVLKALDEGLK